MQNNTHTHTNNTHIQTTYTHICTYTQDTLLYIFALNVFVYFRVVEHLLRNDAKPGMRDNNGYNSVHYAALRGHKFSLEMVWKGTKEMFYLTTHSTHFIYGYMASDIWLRTIQIAREETHCRNMGYSFRLTARVLLYAPSHRQDSTYHSLCYTSRGALAETRNGMKNAGQAIGNFSVFINFK